MIQKIYLENISGKCSRRFISKIFLGNALEDLSQIFQENALEDFSRRYFQEMLQKICLEAYFPTRILLKFSLEECFSKSNDFSRKMFWKISLEYYSRGMFQRLVQKNVLEEHFRRISLEEFIRRMLQKNVLEECSLRRFLTRFQNNVLEEYSRKIVQNIYLKEFQTNVL